MDARLPEAALDAGPTCGGVPVPRPADYWHLGDFLAGKTAALAATVGWLLAALAVGWLVAWLLERGSRRADASRRGWGIPPAIVVGVVLLAAGRSGLGWLDLDQDLLAMIVYHSFAVVFIAGGLQSGPRREERSGGAWAMAMAIPTAGVLQALLGFGLVAAWWAVTHRLLHGGWGMMLTLGFQQGPGQALGIGGSFGRTGMECAGQIGLSFAALGFGFCILFGIPLVAYARRAGWITAEDLRPVARIPTDSRRAPLATQLGLVAFVYAGVWGLLAAFGLALDLLWPFNFVAGALLAIALRRTAQRRARQEAFDDRRLAGISVVAVDVTTASAIAAVKIESLRDYLGPIVVFAVIGGLATFLVCVWAMRRIFRHAVLSHGVVLFGLSTGTIPTGLALLRMVDPELRGSAARDTIVASAMTIPLTAPLVLGIPLLVTGANWSAVGWPIAALSVYLVALLVLRRRTSGRGDR